MPPSFLRILIFPFLATALVFEPAASIAADIAGAAATVNTLKPPERVAQPKLRPASDEPLKTMAKFRVAPEFKISVWAAEPMLGNPVAFALDDQGNVFTAETYRYRTSTLDIRHYMFMLEDDLAARTTDDRIAFLKKNFPTDWQKLGIETEVVRRLSDSNGDGKADQSTVYAAEMNTLLDGINSGVLAHDGKVWCTNMPNLWLFSGLTAQGAAEKRESLSFGYGVRFSFTGHDMHGLQIGPDGRLYFSFGDRGAHVVTKEGKTLAFPDEGAVFRCELDGSNMEVVHRGLRNPQELAFDNHGNLFTGDNDSDQGDRERWVYIVHGGDSGWRVGWQHHPIGKEFNPWLAESMWEPRKEGTPYYILSPIMNIPDGPSGIAHYPGTGLPEEYDGAFFVCGFKGSSARSAIAMLKVKPRGADFQTLLEPKPFIGDVQATDFDFGPDSKMYFSEWGEGWEGTGRGRIFQMEHTGAQQAQAAQIAEVKKLLGEGFAQRSAEELVKLLGHKDQRVRLRAQWALAATPGAAAHFASAAKDATEQLARLHAIWGLGHAARLTALKGDKLLAQNPGWNFSVFAPNQASGMLQPLFALLKDPDAEVRAQAAHVLGDTLAALLNVPANEQHRKSVTPVIEALLPLLRDGQPRVQFFAAQSLARMRAPQAAEPVLGMLRTNDDKDQNVRHAGVMVLAMAGGKTLADAAQDPSRSVRLAALLAMGRTENPQITQFLTDRYPLLVKEAARLINDTPIPAAYGALAEKLSAEKAQELAKDPQLMFRAVNAAFRTGSPEAAQALAQYAATQAPEGFRAEALTLLAQWAKPFPRDRVVGTYRPLPERDAVPAVAALQKVLPQLLASESPRILIGALDAVAALGAKDAGAALAEFIANPAKPAQARSKALQTLATFGDARLANAVKAALTDKNAGLRITAVTMLGRLQPDEAAQQLGAAFPAAEIAEKKSILTSLGELKSPAADKLLVALLGDLQAGKIAPEVQLELLEAAAKRQSPEVKAQLAAYEKSLPPGDLMARFAPTLAGGNREIGEKVFKEHAVAQCFRCHKVGGAGGDAGPDLSKTGAEKDRRYLLESIILPNATIAEGFQTELVTMKNGDIHMGVPRKETAEELTLQMTVPDAPAVKVKKAEIQSREGAPSGMPPGMGDMLTKREIRDIMEYLASLR